MTSTTSSRESLREWKALYSWNLRRSRGLSLLYLGLILLAGPVLLFLAGSVSSTGLSGTAIRSMATVSGGLSLPITMIFTLVFAIQRLGYMHNKRSVDLYHAMPVRRTPMLLSAWSASLTALLVPLLVDVILMILSAMMLGAGEIGLLVTEYFRIFGSLMFFSVVCLTFCMLMAVCSGTTMDMVISIVLTNIFYPLVILMIMLLGSWLLPGFSGNYSLTLITALAPFPAMVIGMLMAGDYIGTLFGYDYPGDIPGVFWGWWVVLLVLMLGASLWLYTCRKSESAESELAFPVPKILLRFLCSAGVGLLAGMIFYLVNSNEAAFFFGFFFFSIMAHAVTEALYSRGLKRFVRTLPSYGAMVLCIVILYLCGATGFFGYDTWMPSGVKSASVHMGYSSNWGYQLSSDWSVEQTPIELWSDDTYSKAIATRDSVTFEDADNIATVQEIQKLLISSRKHTGSPFYSFMINGSSARFTYKTNSGTESRTIITNSNSQDSQVKPLWKKLASSDEWKSQTLPYVLDAQSVSSLRITPNILVENLENSSEYSGYSEYSDTYMEGNEVQVQPTLEETEKLLQLLQKDVQRGDVFYQYETEKCLYLEIDASREFKLTKDSPWYELAPEYEGKWVRQVYTYGSSQLIIAPEMEETYAYLQQLMEKYGGENMQ